VFKKHRERIEQVIAVLGETSENIVGYCNHPMSKVRITMKKDFDMNKLCQQQYKIAFSLWPSVIACIERWYSTEKVEGGNYGEKVNNPLLPVPKKADDGTMKAMRLCCDLRELNKQADDDDRFELPNIPEMLRKIGTKRIFAEMDLSEAFTQFEVEKDSRRWLTFRFMVKCSQYRCLPFGYKSAPGIYQRCLTTMFADMAFMSIFIDNLIVASDDYEQHEKDLIAVIK
jgi:hypothetical protein